MPVVTVFLAVMLLAAGGRACFRSALGLLTGAQKHTLFTGYDRHLPVQGRWLRYGAAGGLFVLGSALFGLAVCCVIGVVFPVFSQQHSP